MFHQLLIVNTLPESKIHAKNNCMRWILKIFFENWLCAYHYMQRQTTVLLNVIYAVVFTSKDNKANVVHVRSRQSRSRPNENELYVEIEAACVDGKWHDQLTGIVAQVKPTVRNITVHSPMSTSSKSKPGSVPQHHVSLDRSDTKCMYHSIHKLT
jgi:hypothetical protein